MLEDSESDIYGSSDDSHTDQEGSDSEGDSDGPNFPQQGVMQDIMNVMSRANQHDIEMCEEAGEDDMSADYDDEEDSENWSMVS